MSKITPGAVVSTFSTGYSNPYGLAFDSSGNLYTSNAGGGTTVRKVGPAGGASSSFATGLSQPEALAFDSFGVLYTANYTAGTISKIATNGTVTTFVTGLTGAYGLAFDASGTLFVSLNTHNNNGSIVKVAPNGTVTPFVTGGILNPYDVMFDNANNLYVAGYPDGGGIGTVYKVTPGGVVSPFVTGLTNPTGLALVGGPVPLPIPEPATLSTLGIFGGMLLMRRRKSLSN